MKKCKLLLLDLDGTLLQSDKTISTRTLSALKKCRGEFGSTCQCHIQFYGNP